MIIEEIFVTSEWGIIYLKQDVKTRNQKEKISEYDYIKIKAIINRHHEENEKTRVGE